MALSRVGDVGRFIRDQRETARLSLRKLSNMAGVSNPYLSQIERGMRRPSAEILQALAKALRISAETMYVKAGILEEGRDEVDPVTAILRDLTVTDKQKQVLIEIYQSFRHENELEGRPAAARAKKPAAAKKAAAKKRAAAAKPAAHKTAQRRAGTTTKRATPRKAVKRAAAATRPSSKKRSTTPARKRAGA